MGMGGGSEGETEGGRASERSEDRQVNKTEKENIPEARPKPALTWALDGEGTVKV